MSFSLRLWGLVGVVVALPGLALAQEVDYSAGKSAPRLFASDCAACHRSPEGLAHGRDAYALTGFLREHYTTKGESAGLLAAYLAGLRGRPQPAARAPATPEQAAAPVATAQPPRPPGRVGGDRPKPGEPRKSKLTPAELERENAKAGDALLAKLRGYASMGEEAKVKPVGLEGLPPAPATAVQTPKPVGDVAPAGAAAPAPATSEPAASAPAGPAGERPPTPPPG